MFKIFALEDPFLDPEEIRKFEYHKPNAKIVKHEISFKPVSGEKTESENNVLEINKKFF